MSFLLRPFASLVRTSAVAHSFPAYAVAQKVAFNQTRFFAEAAVNQTAVEPKKRVVKKKKAKVAKPLNDERIAKLAEKVAANLVKKGKLAAAPPQSELVAWYKNRKATEAASKAERAAKAQASKELRAKKTAELEAREKARAKKAADRLKFTLTQARRAAKRLAAKGELKTEGWGEKEHKEWYASVLKAKEASRTATRAKANALKLAIAQQKKGVVLPFDPKTANPEVVVKWAADRQRAAALTKARNAAKGLKKLPFDLAHVSEADLLAWNEARLAEKKKALLKTARAVARKEKKEESSSSSSSEDEKAPKKKLDKKEHKEKAEAKK